MVLFLLFLLFWVYLVALSYIILYYESANGSHLEVLRSRGSVLLLMLRGFLWSLCSHVLLVGVTVSALHRRFWHLPSGPPGRPPVIFVHGLYHNHTAWYLFVRWFRQWGWRHLKVVNLPGKFRSIHEHAQTLAREIEQVLSSTGGEHVDLVGHSMGGLAIRVYLVHNSEKARVRKVVTLGTPHAGSKLAVFAAGAAAREMVPGSSFLESLNQTGPQVPKQGHLYAIYSIVDNMVLPNESARIRGERVTSIETQPVNHVGLLFCKKTAGLVRRCLDEGEDAGKSSG